MVDEFTLEDLVDKNWEETSLNIADGKETNQQKPPHKGKLAGKFYITPTLFLHVSRYWLCTFECTVYW